MFKKKHLGLIGIFVGTLVLVGTLVVPALADESETTPLPQPGERCEVLVGKVAGNLNVSVEDLKSAVTDASMEMVDEALAEGLLTQEEADLIKQRIEDNEGLCRLGTRSMHRMRSNLENGCNWQGGLQGDKDTTGFGEKMRLRFGGCGQTSN